jgi:polyphosphate kinase
MSSRVRDRAWFDRDLGWLAFNRRVLAQAMDERTPLLERLKFLAISTSNLDEFFMKRMPVLRGSGDDPGHATPELLATLRDGVIAMARDTAAGHREDRAYRTAGEILPDEPGPGHGDIMADDR